MLPPSSVFTCKIYRLAQFRARIAGRTITGKASTSSFVLISLARRSRGVGAERAFLARSSELVLGGSHVSDRDLFGVGYSTAYCEAPLARARINKLNTIPYSLHPLPQKKVKTFEQKRLRVLSMLAMALVCSSGDIAATGIVRAAVESWN